MSRRAAATATLCLAVAASGSVHAQRTTMSQYLRDEWTSDHGFPGGPVHAITQTTDGYLWIGAEKGLVRFDGLTFQLIEPRGVAPNAAPAVLGVVPSPDGSLWARLRGIALLRYRHDAFENILPALGSPESVVTAMERGRDNAILTSTLGLGAQISRDGRVDIDRRHERVSGLVVRHLDGADANRRVLARHAQRRHRSRPGRARDATHGRVAGPESEQPARDGRRQTLDWNRQGRRTVDGNSCQQIGGPGRAGRRSGARDDSRSCGQRVDRRWIRWTGPGRRPWTGEPLGVDRRRSPPRVIGVRGSGRERLGRLGPRYRALAGSGLHVVLNRAGPAGCANRTGVCRRSRTRVVCADKRRIVLDR